MIRKQSVVGDHMIINFKGGTKTPDINLVNFALDGAYVGSVIENFKLRYIDLESFGFKTITLFDILQMNPDDKIFASSCSKETGYVEFVDCKQISHSAYKISVHCVGYGDDEDLNTRSGEYDIEVTDKGVIKSFKFRIH